MHESCKLKPGIGCYGEGEFAAGDWGERPAVSRLQGGAGRGCVIVGKAWWRDGIDIA